MEKEHEAMNYHTILSSPSIFAAKLRPWFIRKLTADISRLNRLANGDRDDVRACVVKAD